MRKTIQKGKNKKINKMYAVELNEFVKRLESEKQENSRVYKSAMSILKTFKV